MIYHKKLRSKTFHNYKKVHQEKQLNHRKRKINNRKDINQIKNSQLINKTYWFFKAIFFKILINKKENKENSKYNLKHPASINKKAKCFHQN